MLFDKRLFDPRGNVAYLAGAPVPGAIRRRTFITVLAAAVAALRNAAFGLCLAGKVHPFVRLHLARTSQGAH